MTSSRPLGLCLLGAALLLLGGCDSARDRQLQSVAKDWSLVVRASQVIPVYPLSEDVQPGDVLLVSEPIEEQAKAYERKGFLPLDQHLARLYPAGIKDFYAGRYGVSGDGVVPGVWQAPATEQVNGWASAPRAAFPSYQFSVQSGSSLGLALPIQGVPVALGLMNTSAATGSVQLSDAHTYGLDTFRLVTAVEAWAFQHRARLRAYAPHGKQRHFLRVISRIYLIGGVDLAIANSAASSAALDAGVPRPVAGLGADGKPLGYAESLAAVQKLIQPQLPGASLRISSASDRVVTMSETFPRPLVIGYVGFDLPILAGGRIGGAISTLAQLSGRPVAAGAAPLVDGVRLAALAQLHAVLRERKDAEAAAMRARLDTLAAKLPPTWPFTVYQNNGEALAVAPAPDLVTGAPVRRTGFADVIDYCALAHDSIAVLDAALVAGGTASERLTWTTARTAARTALGDLAESLRDDPVILDAVDSAFFTSGD